MDFIFKNKIWSFMSFPGCSEGKESACNVGDLGSIPGSGRSPGEGNGTPVFLPGESHGQRSLVGYSPQVAKSWTQLRDFSFTFNSFKPTFSLSSSLSSRGSLVLTHFLP